MTPVEVTKEKFKDKIDWKLYNFLLDRLTVYEDVDHFCYVLVLCGGEFIYSTRKGYFPYTSTMSMNIRNNKEMKFFVGLMQKDNHMEIDRPEKQKYIDSIIDYVITKDHFIIGFKDN